MSFWLLENVDLIPDPVHSELRGATWARQKWSGRGEWYSSEFCFQVSVELCALGKDEFVESNGRLQQCTACEVAATKSTAGLWNRGWFSVICQVLLLLSTVLSLCPVQFEQVWNEGY